MIWRASRRKVFYRFESGFWMLESEASEPFLGQTLDFLGLSNSAWGCKWGKGTGVHFSKIILKGPNWKL